MPSLQNLVGDACKNVEVETKPRRYRPARQQHTRHRAIYFNNAEDFPFSFSPQSGTLMANVPNYTNAAIFGQITEARDVMRIVRR